MAAVLRDAAQQAEKRILALAGAKNIGAKMERAQLALIRRELLRLQGEMWGRITPTLEKHMRVAAAQAAEAGNLIDRTLFNALGGPIPELERAMHMQAQATVEAYMAKTANGIPLSGNVYHAKQLASGQVDKEVGRGILQGFSARQIADSVKDMIRPDVPGGVSYAAMRLGRTELNNAFHTAQIAHHKDNPFVSGQKWNLSGSHPRPDDCNRFAEDSHFKGGDAGVFKPDQVPGKPHPNCLCYLTAVTISEKDFIDGMVNGQYAQHIDEKAYTYAGNVTAC